MKRILTTLFYIALSLLSLCSCSNLGMNASRAENVEDTDIVTNIEVELETKLTHLDGSDYESKNIEVDFDKYSLNYSAIPFYKLQMDGDTLGVFKEDEFAIPVIINPISTDNKSGITLNESGSFSFMHMESNIELIMAASEDNTKYILMKPADNTSTALLNENNVEIIGEYVGIPLKEIAGNLEVSESELYTKIKKGEILKDNKLIEELSLIHNITKDWNLFISNPTEYDATFGTMLPKEYVYAAVEEELEKRKRDMIEAGAVSITLLNTEFYPSDKELDETSLKELEETGYVSLFEEQLYTDENGELQKGMGYMISYYAFEDGTPALMFEDETKLGPCFKDKDGLIYEVVEKEVIDASSTYWVMESSAFEVYLEKLNQEGGW